MTRPGPTRISRARRGATVVAGLALAGACYGPGEPEFVRYTGTIQSPNGPEGAAVIEVAGSGIAGVESHADQFFTGGPGATTRLVLVRATPGTIRFTVIVNRRDDPPVATVIAVSDGANQPRGSLAGYAVDLRREGGS